jgi:hypothetical protein
LLFEQLFEFATIDYCISAIVDEFVDWQFADAFGGADSSVGSVIAVGGALVEIHDD